MYSLIIGQYMPHMRHKNDTSCRRKKIEMSSQKKPEMTLVFKVVLNQVLGVEPPWSFIGELAPRFYSAIPFPDD
jgi:hypothetical protein